MVFPFPQTNLCQDDKLVLYCDNQILIEKFSHFQIAVLCVSVKRPRSKKNWCKKYLVAVCLGKRMCANIGQGKKAKLFFCFLFFSYSGPASTCCHSKCLHRDLNNPFHLFVQKLPHIRTRSSF